MSANPPNEHQPAGVDDEPECVILDPRFLPKIELSLATVIHKSIVYGAASFRVKWGNSEQRMTLVKALKKMEILPTSAALAWLIGAGLPRSLSIELLFKSGSKT